MEKLFTSIWRSIMNFTFHPSKKGEKSKTEVGRMTKTDEERGYTIVDGERLPSRYRVNEIMTVVKKAKSGRCYVNVPSGWLGKTLNLVRSDAVCEDVTDE